MQQLLVMNFSNETRVNEIALSNPGARRVLEDAGVDYCCGGGKSLQDACLHAGVTAGQILLRLQQNSELAGPEDTEWTSASLADLTRHIRERHHQYVRDSIPRLRALLAKIREKHGPKHREIREIEKLFGDVAREMTAHMQKEEQILFPYIDALERSTRGNGSVEPPFFQTVPNPIHAMMKEHDSAGELVRKIRKASNDYKPPADACTSYQATYQELWQFEKDLHLHVHLENNILFPRAVKLEAALV
ncbi:MAG: iron-sulfur cluster repair di-iron protein [Candidatus Acidiferrum sp.]